MHRDPTRFHRRDDGRLVAGVAGGFAREHGVDVLVVRTALVVLTVAAGLGLVVYLVLFARSLPDDRRAPAPANRRRDLAVACVSAGLALMVRSTGLWLGDAVMLPVAVLACGVVVLGTSRTDDADGTQLGAIMAGRHARSRVVVGAVLLALGLVTLALGSALSSSLRIGVFAAAFAIVGLAVLVGPWIAGAAQQAVEERRQRVRVQEREAMAAHLHDSVLQTLALIQRNADDPRRTAALARQQEHELRAWLYGGAAATTATFAAALRTMAADVEARHDLRIEVVTVGDLPSDDRTEAVVAAAREACVNAAKHSGELAVSVFAEVGAEAVEVWVRDRGKGFDLDGVDGSGLGIRHSIEGRLERLGGSAAITSTPGAGTEVHLRLPRTVDVEANP